MAEWSYEYQGWPNPRAHAAIDRIRRQRAVRRALHCLDIPVPKRVNGLLAVGFSEQEAADIVGVDRQSVDNRVIAVDGVIQEK